MLVVDEVDAQQVSLFNNVSYNPEAIKINWSYVYPEADKGTT